MAPTLASRIVALGPGFGLFRDSSFFWRRQFDAGAPRFGKADCNGLLRRAGAMLAFPDVIHLFAYEFSSLRTGRLAFARIFLGSFDSLLFRHHYLHCELVFCAIRRCSSSVGKAFEANCRTSGSWALCDSRRNSATSSWWS